MDAFPATSEWLDHVLAKLNDRPHDTALMDCSEWLNEQIKGPFFDCILAAWLLKYYDDASLRYHKAAAGDIEMLIGGCVGRLLCTVQRGDTQFTVISADRPYSRHDPATGRWIESFATMDPFEVGEDAEVTYPGLQSAAGKFDDLRQLMTEALAMSDAFEVSAAPSESVGLG